MTRRRREATRDEIVAQISEVVRRENPSHTLKDQGRVEAHTREVLEAIDILSGSITGIEIEENVPDSII